MTETSTPNLKVLAQYVRDLSFENPRAPASFQDPRPEIELGVEMNARGTADNHFEVEMKLMAQAKGTNGPVFNIELVYSGLFELINVPQELIEQTLLVDCPRYLFPFARRIIADLTSDGGFYPPMLLDPVDFGVLYMQQRGQSQPGMPNLAKSDDSLSFSGDKDENMHILQEAPKFNA